MGKTILRASHITKIFPGMKALDNVDFDLRQGEVHILVGENGAGKSTLAKVILGAYHADNGELFLEEERVFFSSVKDALSKGIAAVYQELTLVPYLNAAQNIFLNREPKTKLGLIDLKQMKRKSEELLASLNCSYIDVSKPVHDLSVAEQQMIEIAKALSFNPRIIIFDEPTSALSEREVESLFVQINKLKKEGKAIIYVSHRMQEFPLIGDRITILRDGHKIATVGINECSNDELVKMMVGRDVEQVYMRSENKYAKEALRLDDVSDRDGKVQHINMYLKQGEIVGLAGLVGAGRTEIAEVIYGIRKKESGSIYAWGEQINPVSPVAAVKYGIGLISEDRKRQGLALSKSIADNIVGVSLKKIFPHFFTNDEKIRDIGRSFIAKLRIMTTGVDKQCQFLSGGNQQKVVLSKWLSEDPSILIFDEPTRGIDVGAKMEIYALMDKMAQDGKAIIMISSELPEIIGMCDRIYIIHEGKTVGMVERNDPDFNQEMIGNRMMLGKEKANESKTI